MPDPRTVTIGQTLDLPDGSFTIASYGDGNFRLRDDVTNRYHLIHHLELARLLPPGAALSEPTAGELEPSLAEAVDRLDDAAKFLLPHLQELLDGTPAEGNEVRPQYGPGIPMEWKLLSKSKELAGLGHPMPVGTLKRRMLAYRKAGVAALHDGRKSRQEGPLKRADEKVIEALATLIAGYAGRSTPTYTRIRAELHKALIESYPDAEDRPKLPSLKSVERYVRTLSGHKNPTRPAKELETAALVPDRQFRPRRVSAPGDECQADSTHFDALVRFPDGRVGRPYLTILVDKRTRSIVAVNLTANAPCGYDHAVMLAKALVPRPLRTWSKDYEDLGLPRMPWSSHLDETELEQFDSYRPYILPRRIIIDNGQDYRGLVFRMACERYGIHLTEAPPKSPTSKAHVERTFNTIRQKFTQYLPGYVHSNLQSRGTQIAEEGPLDLCVVEDLLERWVSVVYQNRLHDGLVDPLNPSMRHTPNTMFAASVETFGHFVVAYQEDDFISLMPNEPRTVQSDGVEFRGRTYDSPHLAPFRGQKTRDGVSARVPVHYDPGDKYRVWVRGEGGAWITCTWNEQEGLSRPLERQYTDAINDYGTTATAFSNAAADDATLRLVDEATAEQAERMRLAHSESRLRKKEKDRWPNSVHEVLQSGPRGGDGFDDFLDLEAV